MQSKVWQTIEKYHMCPQGAHIVVGVSGGADSMALLHLLNGFAGEQGWSITAVHVHHGLRGEEADRDRNFVQEICQEWKIPCKVYYFDVSKEAKARRLGTEEAGRLLRYEAFEQERQGGMIAVAHNKNDQGETVLMRLCRGAGVSGLTGIRPVREFIIRPLLFCTRKEIEEYCQDKGLSYCEDSTNRENNYTRNRIRNQVLPLLEEIYPKATEHIAQTAEIMTEEEEFLQEQARVLFIKALKKSDENEIVLDAECLKSMHRAMGKRVLAMAFDALEGKKDIGSVHYELLVGLLGQESGKSLYLPNHIIAELSYGALILKKVREMSSHFSYPLPLNQEIYVPEAKLFVGTYLCTKKRTQKSQDSCTKVFDYDKIGCALFCRTRQNGDRLAIKNGRKKLKDFLIDEKIPREERDRLPLIATEDDVLWVVNQRVSAAYLPDENTKKFLTVQIRRFIE
ncbi:tRNA lysidine(34) synthetase TilS [Anaerotignum propionicum]|uniref:tRNA(Ile)-lysidine synthase n=2 Tax=root TaxID=1 RepID=A0A0X8VCA2_ANAPI|nr:tRNA lysidine(34) synthetase TilS [Anaerotignum propionicum]AMJ42298.1 tRNA(Ile)-lysidine synthase [Anaerotignum propionicum DSM 1682]MEA5056784.1 tRNA lysidine(34) synthetase TilS [Anaerotignum propionicum]SHE55815.1 tRNA(Ile)-lysidine synthase [[Clostridium] propionicum DSM 1682] [Anaerotignum propionicum DSM 1682]